MILIYLGSGPTAHTIHRWISDMLEELTIDTRSEGMRYVFAANSNSNLQMQKAGMKLMTPGQVSRMPKDDCILFLEGYRPIYDKKNWPFHTKEFQQAERAAGKQGYTNPVRMIIPGLFEPPVRTLRVLPQISVFFIESPKLWGKI
ncbi:type IV secretory system conjugative DNA transfer family protein [Eubacterium sp. An3]|uniref:type IV secretory system conjugative DNA transfer family protein n=1 Tax=Eubacterium sp. An3 TaxID=1965628 RepID=UPI001302864B|nr:type IV secretory system conjugative DNA transfer family protein [Eubacterium sp. An3]